MYRKFKNLFNRYVWLIDTVYQAREISFEDINAKWMRSELNGKGAEYEPRTFHNNRRAIRKIFDISIERDMRRGGNIYYIEEADGKEQARIRSWLLDVFAVNSFIVESRRLERRILFEHASSGEQFLMPLAEAMKEGVRVEIVYQSDCHAKPHTLEVEPCCLKLFRKDWYAAARSLKDGAVHTYSLSRMREVRLTDKVFTLPEGFEPETYFNDSFSAAVEPDCKPEQVEVKVVDTGKCQYFRSQPLHKSQKEVVQTEGYSIFRYNLRPAQDFRKELLSHGAEVEVLSPQWLREEMAAIARRSSGNYEL